jgi:DNA-binding SARP family transcriptional activator/predicted ATPase/Tfp pilus assembly protein PilF
LRLKLFGAPQVHLNDDPVTGFVTGKAQALLFYLAVTSQTHSRDKLAGLLWPNTTDSKAKKNLRDVVSNLRKLVGPHLVITRQSLALMTGPTVWLDVERFHRAVEADPADQATLQNAVDLYQDDFLAGFYVREALPFEEWVLGQREWLRSLAIQAFHRLSSLYGSQGDYPNALEYTTRLLHLEPWREESHRQMMILLARHGQRSAALVQYEGCRQTLLAELGAEPSLETQRLYESIKAADSAPLHNLPPQPTAFVGRVAEMGQIKAYLEQPAQRLITLVGPGGIGKTRLALQASQDKLTSFLDGVFFVALAPLSSAEYLVSTIAEAIGFAFKGNGLARQQLLDYLQAKEILLILDNFEHLLAANRAGDGGIGLLVDILQQAPYVKILVTSRERLNLQEEWVLELKGLDYPTDHFAGSNPAAGPALETYSAIALFVLQARRIDASFTLPEADVASAIRICQLVDGLPLGIELAVSWSRVLSWSQIATEIEQNLDFLTTSVRNVPARHRSLRVVFEYSWNLLTLDEQRIFPKLSLFRGGFRREAAQHIAGASLAVLAGLIDKSLLRWAGPERYELHELLRQYATLKFEAGAFITPPPGEAGAALEPVQAVRGQFCRYYLAFLRARLAALNGRQPQQAMAEIRGDLDNIRQVWHWATTSVQAWQWLLSTSQLELIEESLSSLARFYDITGLFQEGALDFAAAANQLRQLLASEQAAQPASQLMLGRLMAAQAHLLNRHGLYDQAIQSAQDAAEWAVATTRPDLEAMARHEWGAALLKQSHYDQAEAQLQAALSLARQAGLPGQEAEILRQFGLVQNDQGNLAGAQTMFDQALLRFHQLGDQRGESLVLNNLGNIAEEQGDHLTAQSAFAQALRCFREIGDPWGESIVLNNLGFIAYNQGNYSQAQAIYQQALALSHQLADRRSEGIVLENLANVMREQGYYARAHDYYYQSLHLRRQIGDQRGESHTLAGLALLSHHLADHSAARDYSLTAQRLAQAIGARSPQALALTHLGHALVALGQPEAGLAAYRQAQLLWQALGERHRSLETRAGLIRAFLAQGELEPALEQTEQLLPHLEIEALYGTAEPFRIFLSCYQALHRRQDSRAATILATAYHLLQAKAQNIEDPRLRQSFLESVPSHREVVRLASSAG